eukprot:scaffold107848_cov60-Phaeocystis_antarctica.AAC.3
MGEAPLGLSARPFGTTPFDEAPLGLSASPFGAPFGGTNAVGRRSSSMGFVATNYTREGSQRTKTGHQPKKLTSAPWASPFPGAASRSGARDAAASRRPPRARAAPRALPR